MYKKAVASFWTVEEVDLSEDMRSWVVLRGEMMPMGLFELLPKTRRCLFVRSLHDPA